MDAPTWLEPVLIAASGGLIAGVVVAYLVGFPPGSPAARVAGWIKENVVSLVVAAALLFGAFAAGRFMGGPGEPDTASSPSPPIGSVASPAVSVAAPCPAATDVAWVGIGDRSGGEEAWSEDFVERSIEACQTLMVSSATMNLPGGRRCTSDGSTLCVAVIRADAQESVRVDGLAPVATWWGVTLADIDRAIDDKVGDPDKGWFSPSNCSGGCAEVSVYIFGEGGSSLIEQRQVTPSESP